MSKSINKQRDNLPKKVTPSYPVAIHPAFQVKLKAVWEEGQKLQREMQGLQTRFNELMDLARAVQAEAGQIGADWIVQDLNAGWVPPPAPEPPTAPQTTPTGEGAGDGQQPEP